MSLKKLSFTKEALLSLNSFESEAAAGGKRNEGGNSTPGAGCNGSCMGGQCPSNHTGNITRC